MTVRKKLDQVGVAVSVKSKYERPGECRSHMRKTLAKEFEGIVEGFIRAAKKGSCSHMKLATELLKPDRKEPSRKKGTATKYWEMLQKEEQEKKQLKKEHLAAN